MSSSLFATQALAEQKIGFINTAQIFQALPQREVALRKLQDEFKDKEAELQALENQARTKIEKLKRDAELMSQDDVEKMRIEIGQLDSQLQIKSQSLKQAVARREGEERQRLLQVIQDTTQKIAQSEGYDIVIDVTSMHYGKPEFNLSEKVIKAIK